MKTPSLLPTLAGALLFLGASTLAQALDMGRPFADHMVLQQGMEVPVWGTDKPGNEVTLTFAGQTIKTPVNKEGEWSLKLKPLEASAEGRPMIVQSGEKSLTIQDVLVGEVWVGSGQSNMAGKAAGYMKNDPTLAKLAESGPYPGIRLMSGAGQAQWLVADADSIPGYSAQLIAFGERLHQELDVPVGLILGAVGGTPSGYWMPKETYDSSELIQKEVAAFAETWNADRAQKGYEAKLAVWEKRAAEAKAKGEKAPGRKPSPPVDPGESTRGGKIGNLFDKYIRSSSGYAIRGVLWDQGEAGSGVLGLGQFTSMSELIRGWREVWGQGDFPFLFVQKPSGLGNAYSKDDPITREADKFTELPESANTTGGGNRFLYTSLMTHTQDAWMVPSSDLGPMIHPINKWGYGNRGAQVALEKVYEKEGVQGIGPIYASHAVDGGKVTVTFNQVGDGLTTAHKDEVQGFALAGEDGQWHWATAEIQGPDKVVLSSEVVPAPKHVRFAYASKREWANLFSKSGLPALAFTTELEELPQR